jgi:hypothetical protein
MKGWKLQFMDWASLPLSQRTQLLSAMAERGGRRVSGDGVVFAFSDAEDVEKARVAASAVSVNPKTIFWVG